MTIVGKDASLKYAEIKGNVIPEEYRNQILEHTKHVYLEYIKAKNDKGESVGVKPIAVTVQS